MKRKMEKRVLAEGEVTGHAHRVDVDVFLEENGLRSFCGETDLTHEEHHRINIPALPSGGEWLSGQGREYDHFAEEARKIKD